MNFSEPGCGASTITINSSTPLNFARSLFSTIDSSTENNNISTFTRKLTAIHDAAYLQLLPQTCPAEVDFYQAETSRISNGPLGNHVLNASTLFFINTFRRDALEADGAATTRKLNEDIYEATDLMLRDLAAEQDRYLDNMALLYADMKEEWRRVIIETGSLHRTVLTLGKPAVASGQALANLVRNRPLPNRTTPTNQRPSSQQSRINTAPYLSEIARYWRTWGHGDSRAYEEVWSYIARRPLVQE